jgi:hypothetical protein
VFHLPSTFSWIEFVVRQVNPWRRKPVFKHRRLFTRADVEQGLPPDLSIVECGRFEAYGPLGSRQLKPACLKCRSEVSASRTPCCRITSKLAQSTNPHALSEATA